ncbi:hypothetical protein RRF57_001355 [Xylaria bambusicola]|uniref:Uncharacterized protein n=1 Tax=Xylaria bambusicola TaxID=326684 RepID=A0AAN7UQK9_9PEZI
MPEVDPFVLVAFGPPPDDINLDAETETRNDIITGVFLALAILSVLARWISRKISGAHYRADDYIILIALVRSALMVRSAIHRVNLLLDPMYCYWHREHLV